MARKQKLLAMIGGTYKRNGKTKVFRLYYYDGIRVGLASLSIPDGWICNPTHTVTREIFEREYTHLEEGTAHYGK